MEGAQVYVDREDSMSMIATTSELLENVGNCYKEFLDWRNRQMWYQRVKRLPDLVLYAPIYVDRENTVMAKLSELKTTIPYNQWIHMTLDQECSGNTSIWYDVLRQRTDERPEHRCRYCGCKVQAEWVVCDRCGAPV